jgi:FMN-dependent oxidoreductase (nitrilotriacetate monooxygenase family)
MRIVGRATRRHNGSLAGKPKKPNKHRRDSYPTQWGIENDIARIYNGDLFMTKEPARQMSLIGFLQAQNCSTYPGSWRHAATTPDFMTPEYYQRIARVLEEGKFHMAFFDDRLAMPDIYSGDHADTVAHGIRAVKMDPVSILATMGAVTTHLGLGATYSTTYYEPYHVARTFATLDLMTKGRAAWNVVTSLNDSEAANFGRTEHLEHDLRYDRADEFLETTLGHWDTWQDDALILDKESGCFADPKKVKRLDHKGKFFHSRGPFTVPRSPQGQPVLIQAGQSGRGKTFAARWAEFIFVVYPNLSMAKKQYAEMKQAVADAGRDPCTVQIATAIYVVVAETDEMARQKFEYIDSLAKPNDALALICEVLNYDFSTRDIDEPLNDAEMAAVSGWKTFRDRVVALSGKSNPSVRDFVEYSNRGRLKEYNVFIGSPKTVADELEQWFMEEGCDGFVLAPTHMPGSYEDFVRMVVPELQRRGLFHKDYAGTTLRENLGLPYARSGEWRVSTKTPRPESPASRANDAGAAGTA